MSTTTANMVLIKPDPDGSIGTWDTELNATIDLVDSHDHSTGKGVKVPTAGLNVNADLSFAGFGATALKVVDLAAVLASTVTGYPTAIFVNSADNELYWRTSGGTNVKLTSGASLNAALLGGFTGDYGSGGSEANFNSGTSIFNFLRAANHRAFIDCSDIRLFQGTSGITNAVKIRSPNALAGSYDFILPTALPGSTSLLQLTSGGQAQTTLTPSVTTLATTGAATIGTTLGVTGLITATAGMTADGLVTANAGVTAAANQHVTVSGTGRYKRGSLTRKIAGSGGVEGSTPGSGVFNEGAYSNNSAGNNYIIALQADVGERLTSVNARIFSSAAGDVVMTVRSVSNTGTSTTLGTATSVGPFANENLVVSGLTADVADDDVYLIVKFAFNSTTGVVRGVRWITNVP